MHEPSSAPKNPPRRSFWHLLQAITARTGLGVALIIPGHFDCGTWDTAPVLDANGIRSRPSVEPFDYSISSTGNARRLVLTPRKSAENKCFFKVLVGPPDPPNAVNREFASIVGVKGSNVGINCSLRHHSTEPVKRVESGIVVNDNPCMLDGITGPRYTDPYTEIFKFQLDNTSDSCSLSLEQSLPEWVERIFYCEHNVRRGNVSYGPSACYEITGLGL